MVADRRTARRLPPAEEITEEASAATDRAPDGDEQADKGVRAGFVYPEWNQARNDYYADWCLLREHHPQPHPAL